MFSAILRLKSFGSCGTEAYHQTKHRRVRSTVQQVRGCELVHALLSNLKHGFKVNPINNE